MFYTFNLNYSDLRILLDNNHKQSFDLIDCELLRQLLPFLKVFVDVTERLSNEKQPTLHLVLLFREKLLQEAKASPSNEHPDLIRFKAYFIERLENDWPIQDEHYIATVLHPQFKQLDTFSKRIKRYAHDLVRSKIRNDLTMTSLPSTSTTSSSTSALLSGNNSNHVNLLSSLYDKPRDTHKKKSEFDIYLNSDFRLDEREDLFKFWMQQGENFPQLFQLAKQVLIIPASNTSVERLFSVSGATVTEKRTRLSITKIDKMLFLNKNLHYLKSLRESNQQATSEDAPDLAFISSKCDETLYSSDSSPHAKRIKLLTDDEIWFNEDEQMESDDDLF